MSRLQDEDLHALADGRLDPKRQAEVEQWLAELPEQAQLLAAYRKQNAMLHTLFDPILAEPIPGRMRKRPSSQLMRYAAMFAWLVVGSVAGWMLHDSQAPLASQPLVLARQAAVAHAVYTPEVVHPVEVAAAQEQHLTKWLSKRLGKEVRAPHLDSLGYQLVGGRLLPAEGGPAAQFMYQDGRGQRLTLYVRADVKDNKETAFRFVREDKLAVFYWVDGGMGYALSGDVEKPALLNVANAVYRELNP